MPFRIRPDADFTEEFREAAGSQLRHAITTLEECPDGPHEAIHAFRKNMKRIRSLYRLVATEVPKFQKRENRRLRDAAGSLSGIRDAAALIETAAYLQKNARGPEEAEALGRIVAILKTRRDCMAKADIVVERKLVETAEVLRDAVAALDEVTFRDGHRRNARLLARGWRDHGRKAQAALAACRDEASAEAFHALRKRTQDYRAHCGVLRAVWPAAMKARREAATVVIDRLGHVHDLAVLCDLVETEPRLFSNNDDLTHLLDAIIFRQQEDRREALAEAEALFAEDPDHEAKRIELLWMAAGG